MTILNSAHGGAGWQGRIGSLADEPGTFWGSLGVTSEVGPLRAILMHRPGPEISAVSDAATALWDALLDQELASYQHDMLAECYRNLGVQVDYMQPGELAKPNLYFARDHFFMTPQGAIMSRMGSAARAGEERCSAAALAALGVPILMTVHGSGTFEGADIVYLDQGVVLYPMECAPIGKVAARLLAVLREIDLEPVVVEMPYGTGHIDGGLSIIDRRKAIVRPYHCPYGAIEQLRRLGYELIEIPDEAEARFGMANNLVPVAPGVVIMPAGNPNTERILARHGIECHAVDVSELMKGGGAVHCMTGVIWRDNL